jgi:DNA (cytosine-5)-methyltransferase 1
MFSGYGGLDLGVRAVVGGSVAWVADVCGDLSKGQAHKTPHASPCTILAHHHFGVTTPNLGDVSAVDWSAVAPVDVLTAGFPCQPVSNAGRQRGDDDERWLWDEVDRAICTLRPGLILLENVRGLLTIRGGQLFGRVVGSLAARGYDAAWVSVPASSVGAPHGRLRVFIAAIPQDPQPGHWTFRGADTDGGAGPVLTGRPRLLPTPEAKLGSSGPDYARATRAGSGGDSLHEAVGKLLGTPTARDWKDGSHQPEVPINGLLGRQVWALLPTPNGFHMGNTETPEEWLVRRADVEARTGTRHGPALPVVALSVNDGHPLVQAGDGPQLVDPGTDVWGPYAAAVHQWEALTRPAPAPTKPNAKGNHQLSPEFVEWMMGLPAGHVTGVPGITRNQALKALGNGVVPHQAAAALRWLQPHLQG